MDQLPGKLALLVLCMLHLQCSLRGHPQICCMQVGYVKGVDLSENEILEAQKRFNDAKLERTGA